MIFSVLFYGCAGLGPAFQQGFDDVRDIETDNAIRVEVQKESLQKSTDLQIQVNVQNKDKL